VGVLPEFVAVKIGTFPVPLEARPIAVLEFVHENDPPAGVLTKPVAGTEALLQTVIFDGTVTVGVGLTVMVYEEGVPIQLLRVAVTVIVADMGEIPVFVAINEDIFPVPLEARPIFVFEFVHEYVAPDGLLVKLVAVTEALLQTVIFDGSVTVGVGLTVIVYEDGVPEQLFTVGVTLIIAIISDVPVFAAVNDGILPVPLDASPILLLVFVQENVPPDGVLVKLVAATVPVLQTEIFDGTETVGVGFTVTVYVDEVPAHPLTVGVTAIVLLMADDPEFVAVNIGTFPVPLEARPILVFEFVHENDPPVGVLIKLVVATEELLQTVIFDGTETVGVGLTVIVYELGVPGQLFKVAITLIVAVILDAPVFVAVNAAILPVPLETRPILVFELVQENVPPAGVLVKLVAATDPLLQTEIFAGTETVGEGFTVIVYVDGVPVHPLTVGVTVIVLLMADDPVFEAVNDGTLPVPLETSPILVFEFVHENDPPVGVLVKFVAVTDALLHTVIFEGTETVGVGFTVIV